MNRVFVGWGCPQRRAMFPILWSLVADELLARLNRESFVYTRLHGLLGLVNNWKIFKYCFRAHARDSEYYRDSAELRNSLKNPLRGYLCSSLIKSRLNGSQNPLY
jgi:hypothetical protein